jgi:RND family efflux transporter MFP subunit
MVINTIVALLVIGFLVVRFLQPFGDGAGKEAAGGKAGKAGKGARLGAAAPAVAVEISPVDVQAIQDIGLFSGSLLPKTQYIVSPKVSGRLQKLHVNAGDSVRRGALLAELDDEEFVQTVAQSEAELAIAKANLRESEALLDISRREFERVKSMRAQKISSEAEVESSQAEFQSRQAKHQVTQAQVSQKEAQLKSNRIRLGYTRIEALWSDANGTRFIGERFQEEGALLSANSPIVSVLDLSSVIAVVDVVERQYFRLQVGQKASITTAALPGRVFTGRVARIPPFLNASTRQARVEIEIPNGDLLLKSGMFVVCRIIFAAKDAVACVNNNALVRRGDLRGVFTISREERTARFVPVEIGIVGKDFSEIVSPTDLVGQVTVTLGHHLLEDGATVLLPEDRLKAEAETEAPQGRGKGKEKSKEKGKKGKKEKSGPGAGE